MKSVFIYEVNIQVAEQLYSSYKEWLKGHVVDMVKLPYFSRADYYMTESFGGDAPGFKVHYHLVAREAFDEYISTDAQKMRSQLPQAWLPHISMNRKILELVLAEQ